MGALELVSGELRAGLPRLEGTRLSLVVPLRQSVIDEVLPLLPGLPAGVSVVFGADQKVQARYGAFHVTARLRPDVDLRPVPVLILDLSSQLVAWGLQRASLPSFVGVSGRQLQIRLAEIPALHEVAAFWPHVEHIRCASTADGLEISVALRVTATPGATPSAPEARRPPAVRLAGSDGGRLEAWARQQLAAGMPALAGARVAGTVRVPVDVLNEWVAAAVSDMAAVRPAESGPVPHEGLDLARLASFVRRLRVGATPGAIMLDVEVGTDA